MRFLVWYDENTKKTAQEKGQEAVAAYVGRFTHRPKLVLVNPVDQYLADGIVVRSEGTIQPNNFWVQLEDGA